MLAIIPQNLITLAHSLKTVTFSCPDAVAATKIVAIEGSRLATELVAAGCVAF